MQRNKKIQNPVSYVAGAWIFSITLYTLLHPRVDSSLYLIILAGACALLIFSSVGNNFSSRVELLFLIQAVLFVPIIVSAFSNYVDFKIFANLSLMVIYSFIGWSISSRDRKWVGSGRRIMSAVVVGSIIAFLAGALLMGGQLYGSQWWGRLSYSAHPNLVGLLALTVILSGFVIQNINIRFIVVILMLVVIHETSSRTAMVSALVAILLHTGSSKPLRKKIARGNNSVFLISGLVFCVVLFTMPLYIEYFLNNILMLSDSQRGLNSGLSGRETLWKETLELIRQYPFFGVGYGAHGAVLGFKSYAHNMFLVILADTGVFGLAGFLSASITAIVGLYKRSQSDTQSISKVFLIYIVTYWIYGLTEGRALNVGNPLSIFYIVAVFYGVHSLQYKNRHPKKIRRSFPPFPNYREGTIPQQAQTSPTSQ